TVALKLKLTILPVTPFNVFIGNGDYLECKKECTHSNLRIQGCIFNIGLFVLPIKGADVVLGFQWLELLGYVETNYRELTMISWDNQPVILVGEPKLNGTPLPLNQLHKLASSDSISSLYHLTASSISGPESIFPGILDTELQPLLQNLIRCFRNTHTCHQPELLIIKFIW
ncbi:RVP_2 domain-containing protein, partial [Cephalotus follicularis]